MYFFLSLSLSGKLNINIQPADLQCVAYIFTFFFVLFERNVLHDLNVEKKEKKNGSYCNNVKNKNICTYIKQKNG